MKRHRPLITLFALLVAAICLVPSLMAQSDEITVLVSIDRDTIGLDEQALLQIEISGPEQDLPDPQMPTLPQFEVYSQGRSSSISIVNGVVSSSLTYRYIMIPLKAGTFPINNVAVVHKNRRYKGNRLELTVLDQGTATSPQLEQSAQDADGNGRDYFLEAVVDKKNPFVNEQVTFTLKFFIAVQYYGSPELKEPSTTGFWTEILGNKAPYYQKINNRNYRVIERKYALFPTQTGELTIGRAMITTTVGSKDRRYRDPFGVFGDMLGRGEEVVIRSQPITINVKPLPAAGRPDDFTGTIGNFRINATVNKTQTEVSQPVSLTIRISGTGNIKSVAEPLIPESGDFRVYQASANESVSKVNDAIGGTKTYEEVFIPNVPGQLEIPAISFNYFDPAAGRYKTVTTRAIPITVTKPEGYVASPDVPYADPAYTISSEARDIRYIKSDPGSLSPVGRVFITSPAYLIVNGLPVAVLAAVVVLRRRRERLAGDVGYARSRAALKVARKRLSRAKEIARVEQAADFFAEIYSSLTSYVADKMNISPHGLTTDSIRQLLSERGVDDGLIEKIVQLMQRSDFARYAPSSVNQADIDDALRQGEEAIAALEGVRFDV